MLDYSVLSVATWTLLVILVVELLRHRLDQAALGRPFALTVLEMVYRELSTLGIVESGIFLAHAYVPSFNVPVEQVFAMIHFLLFFTAIFNAFMSSMLAVLSSRISDRMWVRTEEIDLNHYIGIRTELALIENMLRKMDGTVHGPGEGGGGGGGRGRDSFMWSPPTLADAWIGFRQRMHYPLLKRRHDRILMQVRFHDLRVHFLKANNLPLKFHVSDYLKKSELGVFKEMVHITTTAWLLVVAAVEVCYFAMGMTAWGTDSHLTVGKALSGICEFLSPPPPFFSFLPGPLVRFLLPDPST